MQGTEPLSKEAFRKLCLSASAAQPSLGSWALIPKETWEKMLDDVQGSLRIETIYLFFEALYFAVETEDTFVRPPKGFLVKHLGNLLQVKID